MLNQMSMRLLHPTSARRLLSSAASIGDRPVVDVLVVGAGVLGLAIASALEKSKSVFVVEKERRFGQGVSSRSSEVVHAGIYYPMGSLKARWCVEGRRELKKYCKDRNIEINNCGKLIVATNPAQEPSLDRIAAHAKANGVGGAPEEALIRLSGDEARKLESELLCTAALLSPSTAVVNSHNLMASMENDARENGVDFVYGSRFVGATFVPKGRNDAYFEVEITDMDGNQEKIACASIINCAGLHAPDVASAIRTNISSHDGRLPRAFYCKGNYFKLNGVKNPFKQLIYPIPEAHGLGVHLTIDLSGSARFGPDVEWIDKLDKSSYIVNPERCKSFYSAIRTYWPGLPDNCLVPDYAGIRPKLGPSTQAAVDFMVLDKSQHGIPGLVHCLGIESPGLTSSMAIAKHVAKLVNA